MRPKISLNSFIFALNYIHQLGIQVVHCKKKTKNNLNYWRELPDRVFIQFAYLLHKELFSGQTTRQLIEKCDSCFIPSSDAPAVQ